MKQTILFILLTVFKFHATAQREYTISVPTQSYPTGAVVGPEKSKSEKALGQVKQIIHYINLYSSITCMEKLNSQIEDTLQKEMNKLKEQTAYILAINYDGCKILKLYPDHGQKDLWDDYTTVYHITLSPRIVLEPVIKKDNNAVSGAPLLATFKNDKGQWIAMGPYMTTDEFATERLAIGSLFYSDADLLFLCERGKFRIYKVTVKVEHDARDIRYALKQLGVENIPDK